MKRLLLGCGLWLCSLWAWASDSPVTPDYPNSYVPSTDLSLKYLSQLFGNVSNILPGTGSDMMGHLFYALNQGILVVAGLWLTYTIFNILMQAGLEGGLHNPQRKTTMVLFRIAMGLALLVPSSTTGYSAIQDLMMKVVVEGVKLADETWSYALDYMKEGGVLYSTPNVDGLQPGDVENYLRRDAGHAGSRSAGVIQQVYDNEVCMFLSNAYNQKHRNDTGMPRAGEAAKNPYDLVFEQPSQSGSHFSPGKIAFPGFGDVADSYSLSNHSCGQATAITTGSQLGMVQYQEAYNALVQLAMDLKPLARAEADKLTGNDTEINLVSGAAHISDAVMDYLSLIKPYARHQVHQASSANAAFIENAKAEGWFGAGSFYWDLSRLNDSLNESVQLANYGPSVDTTYADSVQTNNDISAQMNIADDDLGVNKAGGNGHPAADQNSIWGKAMHNVYEHVLGASGIGDNPSASAINDKFAAWIQNPYLLWSHPTPVNNDFTTGGVDFASIVQNALGSVIRTVGDIEMNPHDPAFYDPLEFVQKVGRSCLSAAGSIWAKSIAWIIGFAAVAGICSSVNPGSTILNAMINWLTPLWQASAMGLFSAGFMLCFYAPLYPYLLFLFGAIGWMLTVIESMVAAPLVSFGMTHPEGHDFLGRAEQALMLALGVFLRPVLMVVGFLGAMILSYIGFSVVNFSFGQVLTEAFGASDGQGGQTALTAVWTVVNGSPANGQSDHFTGHDLSDFLLIPLLLIGYGLIIIEVVNQCFSLIHVLPDMVLRWIGAPGQQDMTERYAGQIQSGMMGSAKQGAQTAGQGATGFGSFIGGQVVQPATEMATTAALQGGADAMSSGGSSGGGSGGGSAEEAAEMVALL